MTRQEIEQAYEVREDGVIKSLGKFEGEMLYVPYFWDCALQGMFAEDVAGVFFIPLDAEDHALFPELAVSTWDGQHELASKPAYGIALEESEQGFVYAQVYATQAEYNAAVERCEKIESESEVLR